MDRHLGALAYDLLRRAVDDDISIREAAERAEVLIETSEDARLRDAVAQAVRELLDEQLVTFDQFDRNSATGPTWSSRGLAPAEAASAVRREWGDAPRWSGRLVPGAIGWLRITGAGRERAT